jgi:hypothetical protein
VKDMLTGEQEAAAGAEEAVALVERAVRA